MISRKLVDEKASGQESSALDEWRATRHWGDPRFWRSLVSDIVSSNKYDQAVVLFILSNAIFLGVCTAILANAGETEETPAMQAVNVFYTIMFCVELSLRMWAHGCSFFTSKQERAWNFFDLGIILLTTA